MVTRGGKVTDLYQETFGHATPEITPVVGNGGIASTIVDGKLKLNRKALVDRKVRPKLEDVEGKLKKVRADISRLENGFGGDLDKIAEELSELQDDMKFDELQKDIQILKG